MQALHMHEVTFAVEVTSITLKLNGQHVDCASDAEDFYFK